MDAIAPASADDEDEVAGLWRKAGLVIPANDPAADFRRARAGQASDVLVCRDAEGVLGAVMVGHDGHRGWIYYLAVRPDRRREGAGRRLVGAAEAWLRLRAVPKLQLMIRPENEAVRPFYRRLGFEDTPRIVMARRLDA